jgi:hypothetical protein
MDSLLTDDRGKTLMDFGGPGAGAELREEL